jgi:hypothetical protein
MMVVSFTKCLIALLTTVARTIKHLVNYTRIMWQQLSKVLINI